MRSSGFDVAADGRTLAYERRHSDPSDLGPDNRGPVGRSIVNARQLTSGTNQHGTPDISPDGRQVASARDDEAERNYYVTPFTGGAPRLAFRNEVGLVLATLVSG
jgi:hypothetical protein